MKHRLYQLVFVSILCLLLCCCNKKDIGGSQEERLVITLSYNEMDQINSIAYDVVEHFPEYEIKLFNNFIYTITGDSSSQLLTYLASHNAVSDITISSSLTHDLANVDGAFADLSGKSYTSRFQTSYLNDVVMDGSLYYLPLTRRISGLICNKTLFDEHGWKLPTNYGEFATLMRTIAETTDIRPLYDEMQYQTPKYWWNLFYSLNEGSTLLGYQALQRFNDLKNVDVQLPAPYTLEYMDLLLATGSLRETDYALYNGEQKSLEFAFRILDTRETAMVFGSRMTLEGLRTRAMSKDEFVMIPIFSPMNPQGCLFETPNTNIAVSKKADLDPRKSEAIDRIMEYITSREGQQRMLELSTGIKSPCYGLMDTSNRAHMQYILQPLDKGNIVALRQFSYLGYSMNDQMLKYMFHNEDRALTESDLTMAITRSRGESIEIHHANTMKLADVTSDFTPVQTRYLLCAAMSKQTGSELALLPLSNSVNVQGVHPLTESIRTVFFEGVLDTNGVTAVIYRDSPLKVYSLTGEELLKILDYNTSSYILFGATVTYTYDKQLETYVTTGATFPDGSSLQLDRTYTVASSAHTQFAVEMEEAARAPGQTLLGATIAYCQEAGRLDPPVVPIAKYLK